MFAVVRTGGKQYRVAAGDKIAVEKMAGKAGDTVTLGDVLLAGEGDSIADASKVSVSAEIIAQAKSEKIVIFKKRRRHNYRRKAGHRQQMTLLRIMDVGDGKTVRKAAPNTEATPVTAPTEDKMVASETVAAATAATDKTMTDTDASPEKAVRSEDVSNTKPATKDGLAAKPVAKKAAPKKDAAAKKPAAKKAPAKKAD